METVNMKGVNSIEENKKEASQVAGTTSKDFDNIKLNYVNHNGKELSPFK